MTMYAYQNFFKDRSGNAVSSGTITIYQANTATLAKAYSSSAGSSVSSVSSSDNGFFKFWVSDGDYTVDTRFKIELSKVGFKTTTLDDIAVYPDPRKSSSDFTVTGNISSGGNAIFGSSTSTFCLFGTQSSTQMSSTGKVTGFTSNAASTATFVSSSSTFTGNYGTKAYTVSDVVFAMKKAGLMAT